MRGRGAIAAAVALLAVFAAAACGSASDGTETVVGTREVKDNAVLVDGSGRHLYTFSRGVDCTGKCAAVWPPLLADGDVVAADESGLNEDLLGTTARGDGKLQVTYDGEPLYVLAGGGSADEAQQFGGSWQVIRLPIDPLKRERSRGSCEPNCGY